MQQLVSPDQSTPQREGSTGRIALILSVFFHVGILLTVGSVVLIPASVQKSAFVADPDMILSSDLAADEPVESANGTELSELPSSMENSPITSRTDLSSQNDFLVSVNQTNRDPSITKESLASSSATNNVSTAQKPNTHDDESLKQIRMAVGARSLFGSIEKDSKGFLVGYFYDLKQSYNRKPTEMADNASENAQKLKNLYSKTVAEFMDSGFRDGMLRKYYRGTNPLYLSNLWIPFIEEKSSPSAFSVEKEASPNRFFIHYSGEIKPPENGKYRFWGYGNQVLLVAVDGKPVLNAGSLGIPSKEEPIKWFNLKNKNLAYGKWKPMDKGKTYKIDIILGDNTGNLSAFLLVEKEGEKYETDPATGAPILPIFKVNNIPLKLDNNYAKKIKYKFLSEGLVFQAL